MFTTENEREEQILKMAFKQRAVDIIFFKPDYKNYIKMLQFLPDVLILEFPKLHAEQSHFVKLIRAHKKTRKVPIIGYGDKVDPSIKSGIMKRGVNNYLERPLKFSILMNLIESKLQLINKTLKNGEKVAENENKMDDTSVLKSTETLPTKKIQIMVNHVVGLLAFPFTVAKVLKLADDPKAGAADLGKVINSDPVISANILKVSNSVFFASTNRRISSIKDAIVRIGFRETRRIVMGMAVMNLAGQKSRNYGFDRIDFWYHSLACAIFAEYFAKRIGGVSTEEAFLGGLLHDLGMLIMDEYFSDIFAEILEKTADDGALYIEKETAILGVHHNDVIKELFTRWKMPEQVTEGIVNQYNFRSYEGKLDTLGKRLAVCIGAGNVMAKLVHIGRECDLFIKPIPNWVFQMAKMLTGISKDFLETVYRDINLFRQFLKLEEREYLKGGEGIVGAESKSVGIVNLTKDILIPPALFLQKEGMNVELIKSPSQTQDYDGKLNMVLVWAGKQTKSEIINQYTGILKHSESPKGEKDKPEFAPLLVNVNGNSLLPKTDGLRNVSFMDQCFDLRQLEKNIMEVLMGKVIEFVPYDTDGSSSSSIPETKTNSEEPVETEVQAEG